MRPPPLSRAPSASSWSTSSSSSTESVDHSAQYPFIAFPHPIRSTPREADSPRSSYLVKDKESMTHSGQNEEAGSGYSFGFSRRHGPSRSWYGSRLLAELRGNWKPSNTVAFAVPESCFSSKTATVEQVLYSGPSESGINQMLRGWRTIVFGSCEHEWFTHHTRRLTSTNRVERAFDFYPNLRQPPPPHYWLARDILMFPQLIMNILKEGEHTAICICQCSDPRF